MARKLFKKPYPSAGELAEFVGGGLHGDPSILVSGLSSLADAQQEDVSFWTDRRYFSDCLKSLASVYIVQKGFSLEKKTFIETEDASWAFACIAEKYIEQSRPNLRGISPTAIIHESVILGDNVVIGPHVVIEEGCSIGANTVIEGGGVICGTTNIGSDCHLYPLVTVREDTTIGDRVCIHSGVVIGSDGFGFINKNGQQRKIPQVGTVRIGNDVELGSNVTIDRARIGETVIGSGTKIDNQVQIAHNVEIGENCVICGQTGIAGSAIIGDHVVIAAQVGVSGHLKVADKTVLGARACVTKTLNKPGFYSGFPAKEHSKEKRIVASMKTLPKLRKMCNDLTQRLTKMEGDFS